MQAKIKQTSRYGRANFFSGVEFVKFEFRPVPAGFEEQARENEMLEVREGKAEKEVVEKQAAAAIKPFLRARLVSDYKDESLRTFGNSEYIKTEWRAVPEGNEAGARVHELLEVWEYGQPEPTEGKKKVRKYGTNRKISAEAESEE